MGVRLPSKLPSGDTDLLATLGTNLFNSMIAEPLSNLLGWILGEDPANWDTLEELQANLIPALLRLPLKILVELIGDIPIIGDAVEQALADWLSSVSTTATTASTTATEAATTATTASTTATSAQTTATAANNTVQALLGGGSRTIYTSSTTWTKPADAVQIGVICFNAGQDGQGYSARSTDGGYSYQAFAAADVPSSVTITVGASNAAVSSFGSLLSGTAGYGTIISPEGSMVSNSLPGYGGKGYDGTTTAEVGGASPKAAGGTSGGGGLGSNGGAGEAGPTNLTALFGGGGGGGAGNFTAGVAVSYNGGAGGFPGGGGGGKGSGSGGANGAGAPGLVAVIIW